MDLDGHWAVEAFAIGGELQPLLPDTEATLEIEGDRVGGKATINRFMGSLGDETLFGPLATTLMAGPPELMAQEQFYLSHLGKADSYEIAGDELRLISDGLVVVVLRRS